MAKAALPSGWRMFALGAAAAVAAIGIAGLGIAVTGAYNVAASVPHFKFVEDLIELALRRSVDTHSAGIEVPNLDDAGLIRLGAVHFGAGCEPCHGPEGFRPNPVARSMYPAAPPLDPFVTRWETRELFWIVRHGLKYSGMPQWPGRGRDDEVWALVAFIERLPQISPAEYDALVTRSIGFATPLPANVSPADCRPCHGDAERGPVHALAPPLDGQNAAYLLRALEEYAAGNRESGMMEPIAAALSADQRQELAKAFAATAAGKRSQDDVPPDLVAQGQSIATDGIAGQNVPACLACHSGARSQQFPKLAGLPASYIETQLQLFRTGLRGTDTAYGAIMAPIARRLDEQQARQVAAYFASRAGGAAEAVRPVGAGL